MICLKYKSRLAAYLGYVILFIGISLSFLNLSESISVDKFCFEWGIENLIENYHLFSTDFLGFWKATISLHSGDSESGWSSFYYLLPLFLFLKLLGGLSLYNLHLFVFLNAALLLIVFYVLMRRYWGAGAANIGILFFVFSSFFNEIATTAGYHTPTVLLAAVLMLSLFKYHYLPSKKLAVWLGLLSGLSWYYYGVIRFILPVSVGVIACKKDNYKHLALFLLGLVVVCSIGFIFTVSNKGSFFDQENIFYQEPGYQKVFYMTWFNNIRAFWAGLNGKTYHDSHARLMHTILLIPLIIGIVHVCKNIKYKANRLLIFFLFAICFFPVVITFAHWQLRRYILYCIPLYILIGIGGRVLVDYIHSIRNKYYKNVCYILIAALTFQMIAGEFVIINNGIWHRRHERISLLSFGKEVKKYSCIKSFYYLRETPHKLYEVDAEAALLTLILEREYCDKVRAVTSLEFLRNTENDVYIITSPHIQQEALLKECEKRSRNAELIALASYGEGPGEAENFKLYAVKKK